MSVIVSMQMSFMGPFYMNREFGSDTTIRELIVDAIKVLDLYECNDPERYYVSLGKDKFEMDMKLGDLGVKKVVLNIYRKL